MTSADGCERSASRARASWVSDTTVTRMLTRSVETSTNSRLSAAFGTLDLAAHLPQEAGQHLGQARHVEVGRGAAHPPQHHPGQEVDDHRLAQAGHLGLQLVQGRAPGRHLRGHRFGRPRVGTLQAALHRLLHLVARLPGLAREVAQERLPQAFRGAASSSLARASACS